MVCDVDSRDSSLVLNHLQFVPQPLPQGRVEVAERLVQEQNLGVVNEGAREGHTLLLAATQLVGIPLLHRPHFQHLENPVDPFINPDLRSPYLQGISDVVEDSHVRPERVRLVDHPDTSLLWW